MGRFRSRSFRKQFRPITDRIPENVHEWKPFAGKLLLEIRFFFEMLPQVEEMLTGTQPIGQKIRTSAVPFPLYRVVKGHLILSSLLGFNHVDPFEHLAFGNLEFFRTGPAFTVGQGLFPNLLRVQKRLIRRLERCCLLPTFHLIPNIQQNAHRVLAPLFGVRAITGGLNPLIFKAYTCHIIAITPIHIVGK